MDRALEQGDALSRAAEHTVELHGLVKRYGATAALDGVSLAVARGEMVAVVGESGAGKSTLLHVLGALERPSAGEAFLNGEPIGERSDVALAALRNRLVGFVFQFHHLLREFTALENVVLPQLANAVPEGRARDRARDLLDRVGLSARARHRPAEMSGGEQQRVAFCRALANGPALLLADEPTGNLDPATSDHVFAVLMDLVRDTGLSALIATHNLDLAARMDRIVRLDARPARA